MTPARIGLPARVDPIVVSLLSAEAAVTDLVAAWGSPLNLLFPQVFAQNVESVRGVLTGRRLKYRINFAHKANQAGSFAAAAFAAGIQLDVASAGELRRAEAVGFSADRIEATGPKGRDLLAALVGSGVTVNVDNLWELAEIVRLAELRTPAVRVPVLLRLSGFDRTESRSARVSRFGIPLVRSGEALDLLRRSAHALDFLGLAFHLDSSEVREKVRAVDSCLSVFEAAWQGGLTPRILNIGGGFRQVFTADADVFEAYVSALKRGLSGQGPALTWNANTLGYRYENGGIRGIPVFHKYANTTGAVAGLTELLDSPLPGQGGRSVTRVLLENAIELWLEPGKSLVDQAGITLAAVEFVTEAADGSVLVNLDLSRDKICPADQEVMLDPLVISRSPSPLDAGSDRPVGVYFAGNLCLERDMIFNHLTFLERLPQPGDVVAFINTAGYQMDLSASDALLQPRPRKVAVTMLDGAVVAHADEVQEVGPCSTRTSPN